MRKRNVRLVQLLLAAASVVAIVWFVMLSMAFRGEEIESPVGANWEIVSLRSPIQHGTGNRKLYEENHGSRKLIGSFIGQVQQLSEDCVCFSASESPDGRQYFVQCRMRERAHILGPILGDWRVEADGLVRYEPKGNTWSVVEVIPVSRLLAAGREAPWSPAPSE